jgi:hypothetical protein
MKLFECCYHCVAPKRHPGCHSSCPDYIKQKILNDERNAKIAAAKHQEAIEIGYRISSAMRHSRSRRH